MGGPFAVILADDLIDDDVNGSMSQMVDVYEKGKCSVVDVQEVNKEEVKSYGVIAGKQDRDDLWDVEPFVEKSDPKDVSSNVAAVGRCILEPSIFSIFKNAGRGAGVEIQLADGLATQAISEKLLAYKFKGLVWCVRFTIT